MSESSTGLYSVSCRERIKKSSLTVVIFLHIFGFDERMAKVPAAARTKPASSSPLKSTILFTLSLSPSNGLAAYNKKNALLPMMCLLMIYHHKQMVYNVFAMVNHAHVLF